MALAGFVPVWFSGPAANSNRVDFAAPAGGQELNRRGHFPAPVLRSKIEPAAPKFGLILKPESGLKMKPQIEASIHDLYLGDQKRGLTLRPESGLKMRPDSGAPVAGAAPF